MNKLQKVEKEEIIKKILGNTSIDQIPSEQDLHEIMNIEMSKPLNMIDSELVDKCSQLLCSLYQCDDAVNTSELNVVQSKNKLISHIEHDGSHRNWTLLLKQKFVLRTVIATMFIVLIAGIAGVLPKPGALRNQTSDDGEDLITYGQTPSVDAVQYANADRIVGEGIYSAESIEDAFSLLGYRVGMPAWLPSNLSVSQIYISRDTVLDEINVIYSTNEQATLYFDIRVVNDYDGITIAHEQNQQGEVQKLSSGKTVYTAQNIEKNWVLYAEGDVTYQATSDDYDLDILLKLIDTIGE